MPNAYVSDDLTRLVKYINSPKRVSVLFPITRTAPVAEAETVVNYLMESKYDGWEYEKEVRVQPRCQEIDKESSLYFCEFSEQLILKEIITGARCTVTIDEIENALGAYPNPNEIKIIKTRTAANKFEVVRPGQVQSSMKS